MRSLRAVAARLRYRWREGGRRSFAQCGEDLIIAYVLAALGRERITYLDIGAHHPEYLSNTYYFYQRGHRGVCVEPDSTLLPAFRRTRPDDLLLNVGVGTRDGEADFFVLGTPTLNTFSRAEAERFASYGSQRIERVEKVAVRDINGLLREYFPQPPDLLSLDVEGLDMEILEALDFSRHGPVVCCIETLTYTEDRSERKVEEIVEFMRGHDYLVYADTYINTIFVKQSDWRNRQGAR